MNKPEMSVVTTLYNCEKYVKESINSILNQTFKHFEFIIMDDGSTDGTRNIVKSYRDPRIRFFPDTINRKIPYRRNEAISRARSDLIVIHDGDDISLPDRLDETYRVMINHQQIFCIGGHATKIDLEGKEIGEMDYPPEHNPECKKMVIHKCMNPMIDPTTTFRKKKFDELGGYSLEQAIYTVPDFDLWLRATQDGCIFGNLQYPLIKYRENPDGMTGRKKDEMIKAHMIVWTRYMKKMQKGRSEKEDKSSKERPS